MPVNPRWFYGYWMAGAFILAGLVAILKGWPWFGSGLLVYAFGLVVDRPLIGTHAADLPPHERTTRSLIGMLAFLVGTSLTGAALFFEVLS